jgi:opacity protein-like surface antigen
VTRVGIALLVGVAVPAAASPPPPLPPMVTAAAPARASLPRRSAAVGVGYLSTETSAGREQVMGVSINADWRPLRDRLWGVRAQYAYGAIEDGTSLVYSKRRSHLLTVHATRHLRVTGPLHLFGGLGLGAALVHTSATVAGDDQVGLGLKPAWSWTAGIELPFERLVVRLDATGVWHQVSHDQLYALRAGLRF